jgi:hypothetical protein
VFESEHEGSPQMLATKIANAAVETGMPVFHGA